MNINKFPSVIDYKYNSIKETEDGELAAVFKATNILEIPHGFAHLDVLEVSVAELDELPDNFNGVENAKIDAEQAVGPAL